MPAQPSRFDNDPAAQAFARATLTIVDKRTKSVIRPQRTSSKGDGGEIDWTATPTYRTRAYYKDSSGRARVHLRARLEVPRGGIGEEGGGDVVVGLSGVSGAEALLECGCIHPAPIEENSGDDEEGNSSSSEAKEGESSLARDKHGEASDEGDDEEDTWSKELSTIGKEVGSETQSSWKIETTCTFECTIIVDENNDENSADRSKHWAVEGVTIVRSQIERLSSKDPKSPIAALLFDVEIAVCGSGVIRNGVQEMLEEGDLSLCAVLRQRKKYVGNNNNTDESRNSNNSNNQSAMSLLNGNKGGGMAAGLLGLELGGGALSPQLFRHPRPSFGSHGPGIAAAADPNGNYPAIILPQNQLEMHYGTKILRTTPLRIRAKLIPSLQVSVREVCGARAASGSTLVEITVEHSSEWHKEDVIVTGIAFHPGQSRLWNESIKGEGGGDDDDNDDNYPESMLPMSAARPSDGKSMQGGELSVIDMSRRVRWGFAPGTAPELPLVLGPQEAFATVIQIDAGEDVRSRAFLSPISVNAMMGSGVDGNAPNGNDGSRKNGSGDQSSVKHDIATINNTKSRGGGVEGVGERVMITTDARWTTSRVAVENSDAFRVDMSLRGGLQTVCRVGAPLIVSLRVLNLSMEPRDLMLLMAKDGEGRNSGGLHWDKPMRGKRTSIRGRRGSFYANVMGGTMLHNRAHLLEQQMSGAPAKENHSFNTAVVSEVNGYTFGVWGLSGDDDGTTRHHRDHELLAVDAALLLGEVKGQHSIEAELRFVPLREGTLDVPNLKIYDKRGGRWYNCVHTLKIVAAAKA